MSSTAIPASQPAKKVVSNIAGPSFQGLLWTNWLTAINDNIFRWFVIGCGKDYVTPENYGTILMAGTVCFVAPYLMFASIAGWLADRYSKVHVVVGCKIMEIVVMTMAILFLIFSPGVGADGQPESLAGLYFLFATVFLMGTQSALFAPAKVGSIPEMLTQEEISKGNGIFNLATLSAVVIGMGLGGWLADMTGNAGQDRIWLSALVLIGIAVLGTLISFIIKPLQAANPTLKFPVNIFSETFRDLKTLFTSGRLFRVALGVVFFWAIAGFAQLNIDAFADESGAITESQRTPLLFSLILGVGFGSLLAGIASAGRIELGLVPWGVGGIALFCILLTFAPADFITDEAYDWRMYISCALLAGLGISGGFYDVPLASYLQHKSPPAKLGSILAATNFLIFAGILLMSVLFNALRAGNEEGNFEETSAAYLVDVSDDDRAAADKIINEYELAWEAAAATSSSSSLSGFAAPPAVNFLDRLPAFDDDDKPINTNARKVVLDGLIRIDRENFQERDQAVSLNRYKDDILTNSEKRQAKDLVRNAGKLPLFSSRIVFLIAGLLTLPVMVYAAYRLTLEFVRMFFLALMRLLYRIKVRGLENIPHEGPALLVSNHVSFLDGAIPMTLIPRRMRTIAWAGNFKNPLFRKWAEFCDVILITAGPKSIVRGLNEAAEALKEGKLVTIFPEGGISRTGQIRTFREGVQKILSKVDQPIPVIPLFIDQVHGSAFAYDGKNLQKWPKSFRRPLSLHIGEPVEDSTSMFKIHQAVQRLSADSVPHRAGAFESPPAGFIKQCKKQRLQEKIADSTGEKNKRFEVLTRALILRRLLRRGILDPGEKAVGVLIPPSNGGFIVNVALGIDRRVAINLNYSLSEELINFCIEQAGIKHVLTSRRVMEKFEFNLNCDVVYLDDLKDKVTGLDKAMCAFHALVTPAWMLIRMLGLHKIKPRDLLTVVFTSGSTGNPKGVLLSHRNIASNVEAIEQAASFNPDDAMTGILPFFHSFGYTATLWAPAVLDMRVAYHFSPLDPKQVGKLVKRNKLTILVATPTFMRSYLRRCSEEEFATLDIVVAGAERLPGELSEQFEEKFGVRPVEGYGATELSPICSVNIPGSRIFDKFQEDRKEGFVGRPVKNVAAKVTDLDTGEELGPNQSGMLWIKGPNVMLGYMDMPEATDECLIDDWYKTGDVVLIDDDGFIKITGRMSRFSKIGGEMVPHVKIEEVLMRLVDETPDDPTDDQPVIAVTSVPHPKKGERLIVLHRKVGRTVDELRQGLTDEGLPNLFIPSADSFREVEVLPLLGSGKLDLKGIKEMAEEL
ncbi:MAG: MFS transporter, partial [Planctomycetota bacterium]